MTATAENLAGRGRRLVATSIDVLLVPGLTIFLAMITDVAENAEDYQSSTWIVHVFLLAVLSYLLLNGYLLATRAQTIGKWLMRITVVSHKTGERAPLWRLVLIRALFFPLLFLIVVPPVALLPLVDHLAIFGKKRRCVHDYVAGTSVLKLRAD